jgi:hypothetical protein
LIQPIVSGVAYDAANDRVFASLCHLSNLAARRFNCDLADIRLGGDNALRYLRSGGAYGYTRPTISADGRYLFAARTRRNRRFGEPQIDQELVRIDLASDEEIVVQPASQYRYERLVTLGSSGLLAVQGYRSRDDVACRGDFCIDAARVVLINEAGVYVLPGVETMGEVASVRIAVIPLGAQGAWISASFGEVDNSHGFPSRRSRAWLFEGPTLSLSEPMSNVNVMRPAFEQFATAHVADVRWQWTQIYPSGGPVELRAFPRNSETIGGIDQAALADNGYGVRLTKRRDGRFMQLDIEIARNQGVSPWEIVRRASVQYEQPRQAD